MPLTVRCRWCGESHEYLDIFSNNLNNREKNLGKKGFCVKCNMPLFKIRHDDGSEYTKAEYTYLAKYGFLPRIHTKKHSDPTPKRGVLR